MPTQRQISDKREKKLAKEEGIKRVVASGSTPMKKEDLASKGVLIQDKRSGGQSIRIYQQDLELLEHHAMNTGKVPLLSFAFDNTDIDYVAFPRWWLRNQTWWQKLKEGK